MNGSIFAAIIVVTVFVMQGVNAWVAARSAERRTRERYALLAKLADQPRENVDVVISMLREDDAREQTRYIEKRRAARTDAMRGGAMLMAVGFGLSAFLANLTTSQRIWPVGLVLILMGLVIAGFAYFSREGSSTE